MSDQSVLRVDSVEIHPPISARPNLVVLARGVTTTMGWTNGHLVLRNPGATPLDGTYEFDFMATPPSERARDMITPIGGAGVILQLVRNMRAMRVFAKSNCKEQAVTVRQMRSLEGPTFAFDGATGLGWRAVPFTTIAHSSFGGPSSNVETVLGAPEYAAWFGGHPPARPAVAFRKESVVAIGMGAEPTSGYSVEITSIVQITEGCTAPLCFIHYVEHHPRPNEIVAEVVTMPHCVAKCEASGPFIFIAAKSAARGGRAAQGREGGQADPMRGNGARGAVGNS